jgi:hypothetical protein
MEKNWKQTNKDERNSKIDYKQKQMNQLFFFFSVLGIKPRALNKLGKHSKLHPQPLPFLRQGLTV